MSEDSFNEQGGDTHGRQRRRRKRTSRNFEDVASTSRDATKTNISKTVKSRNSNLQDKLPRPNEVTQTKTTSSGNSNSLELSDDKKNRHRRSRKREIKQNIDHEEGRECSTERSRRPPKPRMNRSVSEEVLEIEREMNEKHHGGTRRHTQGDADVTGSFPRNRAENGAHKWSSHSKHHKPKRNKTKERLSRIQNTSAEEENYQGDLDEEASFYSGFKIDKEDLVTEESNSSKMAPIIHAVNSTSLLPSEPLDVLFIEKKDGGFKKEQKTIAAQKTGMSYQATPDDGVKESTISDFALATQKSFKTFALFCHGLLAGVALCQCLFVYSLSNHSDGVENFLSNYYKLSQPIAAMYYFLLVVSMVSVLDSYGLMKIKLGFCDQLLSHPVWALSLIVYLLSLIFTLSVAMIDDRISLYNIEPALWENEKDKRSLIDDWKIVNLMRVIGAILGWILLSWQSGREPSDVSLFDDDHMTTELKIQRKNNLSGNIQRPPFSGYKDVSP